jgi:hypothetical protein
MQIMTYINLYITVKKIYTFSKNIMKNSSLLTFYVKKGKLNITGVVIYLRLYPLNLIRVIPAEGAHAKPIF